MTEVHITHIGGPTTLIEFGGWRLLTDPTFDPPGGTYRFGWGTSSRKLNGPALSPAQIGPLDAVLLTHDHHGDNLDPAGRALLSQAGTVITTVSGARHLGHAAQGLKPWQTTEIAATGKPAIEITATPCWHGPPLSRPITGEVAGFSLRWDGQQHGSLWITGDTVLYQGLRRAAQRLTVSLMVLHLGGVRFPITGPLRYTMPAAQGVRLCELVMPRTVIPVHYEGWRHFQESRKLIDKEFSQAPQSIRQSLRWADPGARLLVTV